MSVTGSDAMHDDLLAQALGALASPTRLQILRALRTPKVLAEIHVRAPESDRNIARQTVREHLNKLIQVGMVSTREVDRAYGDTVEFVANHQTLYALSEEMRGLSRVRPAIEPEGATVHSANARPRANDASVATRGTPSSSARAPRLVMVKGLDEGTIFALRPAAETAARNEWLIGRRRGVAVALDFDPYVSSENSRIIWRDGAHVIENLPDSRNGTSVNFVPLAAGEARALRHGDIVGVGRSLLAYWTD